MTWENTPSMAETLLKDQTGLMCVSYSPISKISASVEYNYQSGLRRLTVDVGESSLNSGWMAYDNHLPVLELEAQTLTALERWQERHIKRALQGYRPWPTARLMRALVAEVLAAKAGSTPWKRLFS